jgi:hypothetical protein
MHFQDDHFYPEIVDVNTLEPLPMGESGELVITTLTKEGMPLLRYRTRDIASLNDDPCPCGRTSVKLNKITGRSDDMLIIRGVNVFPSQIESVLLKTAEIEPHYHINVDRVNNLDTMEIVVELSPNISIDEVAHVEEIRKKLASDMASALSGRKFRTLIFDACFMASVEAVYDLRNVSDYVIASLSEIMGRGMPYDMVLKYLFASGGVEGNLMQYCSEYMRYYSELASGRKSGTISLIDCSRVEALAAAVARVENGGLNEVDANNVQSFELLSEHQFYDLEHFYDLAAKDRTAYSALQNALTDCVLYKNNTPTVFSAYGYGVFDVERNCGLTMNIPSASYELFRSEWLKTSWAKRIGRY